MNERFLHSNNSQISVAQHNPFGLTHEDINKLETFTKHTEENHSLYRQYSENQGKENKFWKKLEEYKGILFKIEQEISQEISGNTDLSQSGTGGGKGSNNGGEGGSGDDNNLGDSDFWKKLWEMVRNVGNFLKQSIEKYSYEWELIYDIIMKFFTQMLDKSSNMKKIIENNSSLVFQLIVDFLKDNKVPTVKDLLNFFLANIKCGTFAPVVEIFEGIQKRRFSKLALGAIKLILNIFSLMYGGILMTFVVNTAKIAAERIIEGPSSSQFNDIKKGIILLNMEAWFYKEEGERGTRRCILI